jgi:hypothetical protein
MKGRQSMKALKPRGRPLKNLRPGLDVIVVFLFLEADIHTRRPLINTGLGS